MKALITVISSLLVGLALASANFSPIHELQFLLENKRRLLSAFAVAMSGYIFLIASVVIAVVEGALQLDAQGFIMGSAVLTASLLLGCIGLGGVLLAKLLIPQPAPSYTNSQTLFSELNKQFNLSETLERAIHNFMTEHPRAEKQEETQADRPEPAPLRRETAAEPLFRDAPAVDVFQH